MFRASAEQVVVPVTVKDAQGRLIGGLEPADFRLLEDGVEQKITGLSADPAPLFDDAKLSRNASVLARCGPPSGGEMFTVLKKTSLEPVYARVSEQARYQYILTHGPKSRPRWPRSFARSRCA